MIKQDVRGSTRMKQLGRRQVTCWLTSEEVAKIEREAPYLRPGEWVRQQLRILLRALPTPGKRSKGK